MQQVLYREYRPETFKEVLGQETIIKILKSQVDTDSVSHAYLFCGTRGTGKTTTARLLAKAVNCLSEDKPCGVCENCMSIKNGTFIDLIEIDAASNNGVGDIRQLRESVIFPPAVGKKKVYIIDEVHMLSREAFNAFLKTLEEPPENVIFILATTEPQKLPQTILSRCLRMDFRRVSEENLVERMREICENRQIDISEETLKLVAANADGSVRDGLTLLDQCISGRSGKITRKDVLDSIGAVGEEWYIDLTKWIMRGDIEEILMLIDTALHEGKDSRQILMGMINHYRNLLLAKYVKHPENTLNMSVENADRIKEQSHQIDLEQIDEIILELAKVSRNMMTTTQPRILLEVACVKLSAEFGRVHSKVTGERFPESHTGNIHRKMSADSQCEKENTAMKNEKILGGDFIDNSLKDTRQSEAIKREPSPKRESTDSGGDNGRSTLSHEYENMKLQNESVKGPSEEKAEGLLPDVDYIGNETVKIAKEQSPSMAILKYTYSKKLKNGEIHVVYQNNTVKKFLEEEEKKNLLQKILLEVTGENLRVILLDEKKEKRVDVEETAKKAGELLGIDVRITD